MKKIILILSIFISPFVYSQKVSSLSQKTVYSENDLVTITDTTGGTKSLSNATITNFKANYFSELVGNDTITASTLFYTDVATSTALPSVTYSNDTLRATANGVVPVITAITLDTGYTVLIKNQAAQLQNGIYTLIDKGSDSTTFIFVRPSYYNESSEIYPSQINVLRGSGNVGKYFLQTTPTPTVGVSSIVYRTGPIPVAVNFPLKFVDVETFDGLPTCTYSSGTNVSAPGQYATLTATVNGVFPTIQGVVPYTNMPVLVDHQVDSTQNGDYILIKTGSTNSTWQLRRISFLSNHFYPHVWEVKAGTAKGKLFQQDNKRLVNENIGISGNIAFTEIKSFTNPNFIGATISGVLTATTITTSTMTASVYNGLPYELSFAASDEGTALIVDTNSITLYAPTTFTITSVIVSLTTPQASGSTFTVDIKKNGTTIFSTKPTIDNGEYTTLTAATASVLSSTTVTQGDKIVAYRQQIGNGTAKGVKFYIKGTR